MAVFSLTEIGQEERVKPTVPSRTRRRGAAPASKHGSQHVKQVAGVRTVGPQEDAVSKAESLEQLVEVPMVSFFDVIDLDRRVAGFFGPTASDEMRAQGLLVIRAVARNNPSAVINRGYLQHVFQWLASRNRLLRPCAAAALAALSSQKMGREALFRSRDVMPRLVAMMRCGVHSLDAQYAALAVANWSLHPSCKDLIGRVGGIPVLVSLLKQATSKPTPTQLVLLRKAQEGEVTPRNERKSPRRAAAPQQCSESDPATAAATAAAAAVQCASRRGYIPDAQLRMLTARPAAVHAVTALINVVDHERNKCRMMAAGLPTVVSEALCCPLHSVLAERARLLSTMIGFAEIRHAAIQRALAGRGAKHQPADSAGAPSSTAKQQQQPTMDADDALEVALELGQILHVQDAQQDALREKAVRRRERHERRAARLDSQHNLLQQQQQQQHDNHHAQQHSTAASVAGMTGATPSRSQSQLDRHNDDTPSRRQHQAEGDEAQDMHVYVRQQGGASPKGGHLRPGSTEGLASRPTSVGRGQGMLPAIGPARTGKTSPIPSGGKGTSSVVALPSLV